MHFLQLQALLNHSCGTHKKVLHVPSVENVPADICSHTFQLTDSALVSQFNASFPIQPSWQMLPLWPDLASWMSMLFWQTQPLASPPPIQAGSMWHPFWTFFVGLNLDELLLDVMIPSLSFNSMPDIATQETFLPVNVQGALTQWNRLFILLASYLPAWGPMICA